jgi:large subunit ribosomal protein L7/L12
MDRVVPLIETLSQLTVLEAAELVKKLEVAWGVSAQPVPALPPPVVRPTPLPETFTVVLVGAGPRRIEVIRELKELLGLGLAEARTLLERLPAPLREGLTAEARDRLVARLTAAGAEVAVR